MPLGMPAPRMTPRPAAPRPATPMARGPVGSLGQRAASIEKQTLDHIQKPNLEDRTLGFLHGVRQAGLSLFTFGWVQIPGFPMALPLPAMAAGLLARFGLKSAKTVSDMALKAPIQALHETTLSEWYKAPAKALEGASKMAATSDGKLARGLADPLSKAAETVGKRGEQLGAVVSNTLQPVRGAVKKGVTDFGQTGMGKQVEGGLSSLLSWRGDVNMAKSGKAASKAGDAFVREVPGIRKSIMNFFTRGKPATVALAPEFAAAHSLVKDGKLNEGVQALQQVLTGTEASMQALMKSQGLAKAGKTAEALQALSDVALTSASSKQALAQGEALLKAGNGKEAMDALGKVFTAGDNQMYQQGQNALKHLSQASNLAGSAQHFKDSLGKGLQGVVSGMAKAGGKTKLFYGILAVGTAAGITATWMMANKEGRLAKKTLKDFTAAVGDKNHPLVVSASKLNRGQAVGRFAGAALSSASESVMLSPAASFGTAMGLQLLPMGVTLLIKQNEVLNAYAALTEIEKGKLTVEPKQQAHLILQMMVATGGIHEGLRNELAAAVAMEMVERKFTTQQVVDTVKEPAKLNTLTEEVFARQQAAAKEASAAQQAAKTPEVAAPAAAEGTTLKPANDGPSATMTKAPFNANAAVGKIDLANVANEGRIEERMRARG